MPSYHLAPASHARDAAICTQQVDEGFVFLAERPLATALLPAVKSKRCDFCLRPVETQARCSKCKASWYCGADCEDIKYGILDICHAVWLGQKNDWYSQHKTVCSLRRNHVCDTVLSRLDGQLLISLLAKSHPDFLRLFTDRGSESDTSQPSVLLHLLPGVPNPLTKSDELPLIAQRCSWSLNLMQHLL